VLKTEMRQNRGNLPIWIIVVLHLIDGIEFDKRSWGGSYGAL
jgi:hypothetical protein